jgi:hypothetical protein
MTENEAGFLEARVMPLEDYLLELPLGGLFTGEIYTDTNQPLLTR